MADFKPMGIGVIGQPDMRFKQNYRFTFEIFGFCNNAANIVPEHFVKAASRPSLEIEEIEINHLNAKTWIPGKGTWQTINVTYYDVANIQQRALWNWMATIYDFTDPVNLKQGERVNWSATGALNMYDGCGTLLEGWELQHMFPTSIEFGELDYESSEISEIQLTLRYSNVKYRSYCPDYTPIGCCTGCS
jgi:hypothetical protein